MRGVGLLPEGHTSGNTGPLQIQPRKPGIDHQDLSCCLLRGPQGLQALQVEPNTALLRQQHIRALLHQQPAVCLAQGCQHCVVVPLQRVLWVSQQAMVGQHISPQPGGIQPCTHERFHTATQLSTTNT